MNSRSFAKAIWFLFLFMMIFGCQEVNVPSRNAQSKDKDGLGGIDIKGLPRLSERKIFFGHQSVGFNILQGIDELLRDSKETRLTVVNFEIDGIPPEGRGIFEAKIGTNGNPFKKIDEFKKVVLGGEGTTPWEMAFFKFCYVDFYENADVEKIFEAYKRSITEIRTKLPGLIVVHMTVPLTTGTPSVKERIKGVLGRKEIEFLGNIKRNRFNDLMRAEYAGNAPLFDLAGYESTRPDSSRAAFQYEGKSYEMLDRGYTDDGGHLNGKGRDWVAWNLLSYLSGLSGK